MGRQNGHSKTISIHALREEGDVHTASSITSGSISIHALREEGDTQMMGYTSTVKISIHALREEGDPSGLIIFVW